MSKTKQLQELKKKNNGVSKRAERRMLDWIQLQTRNATLEERTLNSINCSMHSRTVNTCELIDSIIDVALIFLENDGVIRIGGPDV